MLTKEIAKVLVGAGLLGMLVCGAHAGDKADSPGPIDSLSDLQEAGKMLFKLADTNNDNRISQKEAVDAANLVAGGFFFRADLNGDGVVTQDEARQAREAMLNQKPLLRFVFQRAESETAQQGTQSAINQGQRNAIALIDTNRDGNFQAAEVRQAVQTGVQTVFLTADKNADGQLDPSEVNGAIAEAGRTAVQTAFNTADEDKNGAVSRAEFDKAIINPANVVFRIFDANNDNQISADELRTGTQILSRELKSLRVPEPANSLSNQLAQPTQASTPGTASITQPAAAPAPSTTVNPPQR